MIVAGAFLSQTMRRDGQQGERRARPHIPDRFAKFPGGFQLPVRAVGHDAQIHVAVRSRFASRIRAEQVYRLQRHDTIHRLQTIRERLTLALQARRQIVEAEFHAAKLQRPRRGGKLRRARSDTPNQPSHGRFRNSMMCWCGNVPMVSTQSSGRTLISLRTCASVILWTSLTGTFGSSPRNSTNTMYKSTSRGACRLQKTFSG